MAPEGPRKVATGGAQRNPWEPEPLRRFRPGRGGGNAKTRRRVDQGLLTRLPGIPPPLRGGLVVCVPVHGFRFAPPVATVRRPFGAKTRRDEARPWTILGTAVALALVALCSTSVCWAADTPTADAADFARVRADEQARITLINKVRPAVVCIFNRGNRAGGGSGVIIDEQGYGLTNFHVVAGMLGDRAGDAGMLDGEIYEIDILGIDPTGDVAMFRAHGRDAFPYVELGDSDALTVGDYTLAMGNPFLLAEDYASTVTLGIVSGLHRYQWGAGGKGRALRYTDCIQVDTSINPGNSGGPLFDLAGRLIGINGRVSVEERGRVNVGVGYAISINQIKRFIPALRAGLPTKHATAGFTVADRDDGVVVNQIIDDSPAYKAGLRLGDTVTRFGDSAIHSANQFGSLLGVYPADWPVEVVFKRRGDARKLRFRLEDLPFPKSEGPSQMGGPTDPYAPHKVRTTANRRAVQRAFDAYHREIGGRPAALGLREIRATGRRAVTGRNQTAPPPLDITETRDGPGLQANMPPAEIERALRWAMLEPPNRETVKGYAVVSSDEVQGRVAVVIERKRDGEPTCRLAFDDAEGRLLRVAFDDALSGKRIRFEYLDEKRVGRMKLPHTRLLYIDDKLYAEDRFDRITIKG